MSSNRHRKRSRSRDSSRQHSNSKKQKSSSRNDNSQEMLSTILSTLQDLKYEINSCNKRISSLENRQTPQNVSEIRQEDRILGIAERDGDTLSVEAGNDLDGSDPVQTGSSGLQPLDVASQLQKSATQPTSLAFQPSKLANQPVTPVTTGQAEACQEPQDKIVNTSSGLYDPEIADTSWAPTEELKNFLEKHFRRKLKFDQVCDILEEQAVPSVDALVAPVFDPSMLQYVAASNKKFIQERDRELAGIQRAILNATGPLCTLHDQLEQGATLQPPRTSN